MKYAVIKTGGKQYKIAEGDIINIEKINAKVKDKITLDNVLLLRSEKKILIGNPRVAKAKVAAEVLDCFKEKKIRVVKFKAKSRYRKTQGHRQQKAKIKILKISILN